jgi:hypothetical protein
MPKRLTEISREIFWETLSNTCPRGSDYLNSLPTVQQLYIILELIEVNDERVQKTITETSHHVLSIIQLGIFLVIYNLNHMKDALIPAFLRAAKNT